MRTWLVTPLKRERKLELDSEDPLVDTSCLVFTLDDGRRWELLDAVDSDMGLLVCKQIRGDDDLVTSFDRSREHDERAMTVPIRGHDLKLPWTIAGITEVWAARHEPPYFRGVAFWAKEDKTDHALLTLFCDSIDEGFMIMAAEQWREYLHFDQVLVIGSRNTYALVWMTSIRVAKRGHPPLIFQ